MMLSFSKRLVNITKSTKCGINFQVGLQTRNFARGRKEYEEPGGFVEDDTCDPNDIKIPYMDDITRGQLYNKHKNDPKTWTAEKLSQFYGSSLERTNAILYFMEARQRFIVESGFKLNEAGTGPIIPSKYREIVELHNSTDPKMKISEIAAKVDMTGQEAEVERILVITSHHLQMMENIEEYQNEMKENLAEWAEEGVNTAFQETPTVRETLRDGYWPALLGDEDFEKHKAKLVRQIIQETKAVFVRDVDYYVKKHSMPEAVAKVDLEATKGMTELDEATKAAEEKPYHLTVEDVLNAKPKHDYSNVKRFSKVKWAYRDLSYQNYKGNARMLKHEDPELVKSLPKDLMGNTIYPKDTKLRKSVHAHAAPPPTMILTRHGVWRRANPLEEMKRTWASNPRFTSLDHPNNRDRIKAYADDWDGDDALVAAQFKAIRQAKKEQRIAYGLPAYKERRSKK